MAITPARPEEYEEAQRILRTEVRAPTVEARNVALATETDTTSYFDFDGTTYKVPPVPYNLGVQLQEIKLELDRLVVIEKATDNLKDATLPEKTRHLEAILLCYERAVDIFWKASHPLAWWKRRRHKTTNPFLGITSQQEVGELLGFFFMCRMKSRVTIQGGLVNRPSLSTLTQRTS